MTNRCCLFLIIALWGLYLQSAFSESFIRAQARDFSRGYGYISFCDGADAVYSNPALVSRRGFQDLSVGYSRLLTGLDNDNISQIHLTYSSPQIYGFGAGCGFYQLSSKIYSEIDVALSFGHGIDFSDALSLRYGVSGHLFRFQYDDYDPTDPVFSDRDSRTSFGLTPGLSLRYSKLSVGAGYKNLVQPKTALSDTASIKDSPQSVNLGLSYNIKSLGLVPSIGLKVAQNIADDEWELKPSVGITGNFFSDILSFSISLTDNDVNFGIGIYPEISSKKASFDYAFTHPKGKRADAGLYNHHVEAGISLPYKIKERALPNLSIRNLRIDRDIVPLGDSVSISFAVHKKGKVKNPRLSLSINGAFIHTDSTLIDIKGDSLFFQRSIPAKEAGTCSLTVSVSSSSLVESDDSDNSLSTLFTVSSDLYAQILPQNTKLKIDKLTYISEEEPFVPIIFFDPLSSDIPSRFNKTLTVLSERLKANPDVALDLHGFIDQRPIV
jgi:hypothetical protein